MKKIIFLIAIFVSSISLSYTQCSWLSVGDDFYGQVGSYRFRTPKVARTHSGTLYLLCDELADKRVLLKRWTGTSLEILDTLLLPDPPWLPVVAPFSDMLINDNDDIFIAYTTTSTDAHVYAFNGSSLMDLPGLYAGALNTGSIKLDYDGLNNRLYCAFVNDDGVIFVKYFDGSTWTQVGSFISSPFASGAIDIEYNENNGQPYLAIQDINAFNTLRILTFNDTDWVTAYPLDIPTTIDLGFYSSNNRINLEFTSEWKPLVAYTTEDSVNFVKVLTYDSAGWEDHSIILPGMKGLNWDMDIKTNADGTWYASFMADEIALHPEHLYYLQKHDSTGWNTMVSDSLGSDWDHFISTAFGDSNDAWVLHGSESVKPSLKYYAPNGVTQLGNKGMDNAYVAHAGLAMYTENSMYYVTLHQGLYGLAEARPKCYRYNIANNYWDTLPPLPLHLTMEYNSSYPLANFTVNQQGNLFVIARDSLTHLQAVYTFNGILWQQIGGVLPNFNNTVQLINSPLNTLYICGRTGVTTTVLEYNGTGWIDLNFTPSVPPGGHTLQSITADDAGNIFVMLRLTGTVKNMFKYDGVAWSLVSVDSNYTYRSIYWNEHDGYIYQCGNDVSLSQQVTVKKWTGLQWEVLGTPGFTPFVGKHSTISFGPLGYPILSCYEQVVAEDSSRVHVFSFDGTDWAEAGIAGDINPLFSSFPRMQNDTSGNIYLGYSNYGGFIKKLEWDTLSVIGAEDVYVYEGGNINLQVSPIAGAGYQWQVSTGGPFVQIEDNVQYSGAHTAQLTIQNVVSPMDSYVYRCLISDVCSWGISDIAHIYFITGIEKEENKDVFLYPNPGIDYLIIDGNSPGEESSVSVADLNGKQIYAAPLNKWPYEIQTAGLSPGIYFVRIENGENVVNKIWIKR
jgi:hypothetical protein